MEKKKIWKENININNKYISFKVDTGSDVTVLPKRLCDIVAPNCMLKPSNTVLRGFGGGVVRPVGSVKFLAAHKGKPRIIECEVVETDTVPLLGLDACIQFEMINVKEKNIEQKRARNHFL